MKCDQVAPRHGPYEILKVIYVI